MYIVITTLFVDNEGFSTYVENSFTNKANYTSLDIRVLLEDRNMIDEVVPSLLYLKDIGNNPNVFSSPNGQSYFVSIVEIALHIQMQASFYDTNKDIGDLIKALITPGVRTGILKDLLAKSNAEISERVEWSNKQRALYGI